MAKVLSKLGIKKKIEVSPGTRVIPTDTVYTEEYFDIEPEFISEEYKKMGLYGGSDKKTFLKDFKSANFTEASAGPGGETSSAEGLFSQNV